MSDMKRLIECYVPIYVCNMQCEYCYIKQNPGRDFQKKIEKFPYSPEKIAYALRKKRLGGICLINLCAGGETLLSHETVELAQLLLEEGHYVMIVTNGTVTKHIKELSCFPTELKKRMWIRFSYHFLELKKLNKMELFFENVNLIKKSGASIAIEMVASDDYIPYIDEIKQLCLDNIGALPEINIARREEDFSILTDLGKEEYIRIWSQFRSSSFDFKLNTIGVKRKEFCYAGDWTATLHLGTGEISKCYSEPFQNIYKDFDQPIFFEAMGSRCHLPYCHNSHIWLTLGDIPELEFPTFAQIRNRKCSDGSEWLTVEMKEFINGKFIDTHKKYSFWKKAYINRKTDIKKYFTLLKTEILKLGRRVKHKLR